MLSANNYVGSFIKGSITCFALLAIFLASKSFFFQRPFRQLLLSSEASRLVIKKSSPVLHGINQ